MRRGLDTSMKKGSILDLGQRALARPVIKPIGSHPNALESQIYN